MTRRSTLFVTAALPEAEAIFGKSREDWADRTDYLIRGNVIVTGMGPKAAECGLRAALDQLPDVTAVIGVGVAGALSPNAEVGDVIVPTEIRYGLALETPTTNLLPNSSLPKSKLVTVDHLVSSSAEKAGLHAATGATAVDMESALWGKVCRERGVPWAVVRSILDRADENLPTTVGSICDRFGRPRAARIVPWLFTPGNLTWGIRIQRRLKGPATAALRKMLDETENKTEEGHGQTVIPEERQFPAANPSK